MKCNDKVRGVARREEENDMSRFFAISQIARRLGIDPGVLSNGLYRGWIDSTQCPLVGNRRLIPEEAVAGIRETLVQRGYLDADGRPQKVRLGRRRKAVEAAGAA
jgi:hypothetical protein